MVDTSGMTGVEIADMYYKKSCIRHDDEVWKRLIYLGHKTSYEVSNYGAVRNVSTGQILRTYPSRDGSNNLSYVRFGVLITSNNGWRRRANVVVHRAVALMFIPNPDNKEQVNHKNGDIYDNRVENLEWVSCQENIAHAIENGFRGEHPKLWSEHDIRLICKALKEHCTRVTAYAKYKDQLETKHTFDQFSAAFYRVKYKTAWTNISKEYNI